MRTTLRMLVCLMVSATFAAAQTAAEKIAAGRAALGARDLPAAQALFAEALVLAPQDQTAAALAGVTRYLGLTGLPSSHVFLDRLMVGSAGRSAFRWDASLARDANGVVVLPANYNVTEPAVFWRSVFLPESEQVRTTLAQVTDPGFLLTLTPGETGLPLVTQIDRGDVLMIQALLRAVEFLLHLLSGQNLEANGEALYQLSRGHLMTLQRVFGDNPDFMKPGVLSERQAARAALLETIQLYRQASEAMRLRPTGVERLVMIEATTGEAAFRADLDEIERSLREPVRLGHQERHAFAAPLFSSDWSLRSSLPAFTAGGFDFTTGNSPSIGGLVTGFTREKVAAYLENGTSTMADFGWEFAHPRPNGNALRRYFALPDGTHLVAGDAGTFLRSSNGTQWTRGPVNDLGHVRGLAAGGGTVAVVGHNDFRFSRDGGVPWSRISVGFGSFSGPFDALAYGAGRFLAVGSGVTGVWVPGVSTSMSSGGTNVDWADVVFTADGFLAVGRIVGATAALDRAVIGRWTDASGWTLEHTAADPGFGFRAVAHGGGRTVAVGSRNQRAVASGSLSWSHGTILPAGVATFHGVAYRDGLFLAAGDGGVLATSTDGTNWTGVTSGETVDFTSVGAGPDAFYVTSAAGLLLRSTDGVTFARVIPLQASPVLNATLLAMRAIDGQLYVAGTGGTLARSSDGLTFSALAAGTSANLWGIVKQGAVFYAVGNGGTILASLDGTRWTPRVSGTAADLRSIAFLNDRLVVTGADGTLLTSTDGLTWIRRNTGVSGTLYGAAFGHGTYVAVGGLNDRDASHVLTSSDGVNWTVRSLGNDQRTLRAVVFHEGAFVAGGLEGALYRSPNGVDWTWQATGAFTSILGLRAAEGRCYALRSVGVEFANGEQSAVSVSADGVDWASCAQGTALTQYVAEVFQGRLYTCGAGGSILRSRLFPPVAAPVVRAQTTDRQARAGDTVVVGAVVDTDGAAAYQWLRDGLPIAGATAAVWTLGNIQPGDAGTYSLRVLNSGGPATSAGIRVGVDAAPVAPVITGAPESRTLHAGLGTTLAVRFSGTLPVSYHWKRDGEPIAGATDATLTLARSTAESAGRYTVSITNAAGSATSDAALLTIDPAAAYLFTNLAGSARLSGALDGVGAAARFSSPTGVAVDAAGNAYVADYRNHTIRKVTPAGLVSTVAGVAGAPGHVDAAGSAARFNLPGSVAIDSTGTLLYVGEWGNSAVRRVSLATGGVSTLATGMTVAGLAVDGTGGVCVLQGHAVRRIPPAGAITTVAGSISAFGAVDGTGTEARFINPGGIALDGAGNIFVADTGTQTIRRITPLGVVTTIAGAFYSRGFVDGPATVARFNDPRALAVGPDGSVMVIDSSNRRLRSIAADGTVRTIAGRSEWSPGSEGLGAALFLAYPIGVAADPAGAIYLLDGDDFTLRKGRPSTAPLPPVIDAPPRAAIALAGGDATLSVNAWGAPPFSYQWRRNGVPLAGATDARYVLTGAQLDHAGAYDVIVGNAQGSTVSAPVPLTVHAAPVVTTPPGGRALFVGQSAALAVSATGVPAPAYQWRRNGAILPGGTTPTLLLTDVQITDTGIYDVVVSNILGSATSAPATLTVTVMTPAIRTQPLSQTANAGVTVTFSVVADGTAPLTYQWKKGTTAIPGANAAMHVISGVQSADAGAYSVVVTNSAGAATSRMATLSVVPAGVTARHVLVGGGFLPEGEITIANTFSYPGTASTLRWDVLLPDGWSYVSSAGSVGEVTSGAGGLVERVWTTVPPSPVEFRYTVRAPAGVATEAVLAAMVTLQPGGTPVSLMALPDPFVIPRLSFHGADTDRDFALSLFELTRVIELYNTRNGTQRTGAYRPEAANLEDGFAGEPARLAGAAATLSRYHSADTRGATPGTPPDGAIDLFELTRVIELYNTRAGTVRTGRYRVLAGTEDGFAAGP